MNLLDKWLAALLVLGISLASVYCLKCHECSTANPGEDDCASIAEGSKKYLVDCKGPKNKSCRIQEQWVDFDVLSQGSEDRTIRQCASIEYDPDKPCYYRSGFGGKVSVCHCIGDGCNDSTRTASTMLLTVAAFFLLKLLV